MIREPLHMDRLHPEMRALLVLWVCLGVPLLTLGFIPELLILCIGFTAAAVLIARRHRPAPRCPGHLSLDEEHLGWEGEHGLPGSLTCTEVDDRTRCSWFFDGIHECVVAPLSDDHGHICMCHHGWETGADPEPERPPVCPLDDPDLPLIPDLDLLFREMVAELHPVVELEMAR